MKLPEALPPYDIWVDLAEELNELNEDLLEALENLITDYEVIGGEDIYDEAYKQAKEAVLKAKVMGLALGNNWHLPEVA